MPDRAAKDNAEAISMVIAEMDGGKPVSTEVLTHYLRTLALACFHLQAENLELRQRIGRVEGQQLSQAKAIKALRNAGTPGEDSVIDQTEGGK